MSEPTITLPLALCQSMANVLKQLPYGDVAPILNELSKIPANKMLEEVIVKDPPDQEGSPPAS